MTTELRILVRCNCAPNRKSSAVENRIPKYMNSCVAAKPSHPYPWYICTSWRYIHIWPLQEPKNWPLATRLQLQKFSFYSVGIFRWQQGNNWTRSERCIPYLKTKSQGCTCRKLFGRPPKFTIIIESKINSKSKTKDETNPINFLHSTSNKWTVCMRAAY